jgi:hypothetical protein
MDIDTNSNTCTNITCNIWYVVYMALYMAVYGFLCYFYFFYSMKGSTYFTTILPSYVLEHFLLLCACI